MKTTYIKILTGFCLIFLSFAGCGDSDIINIYNKYTEQYRKTPDDMLEHNDSLLTVKILNSFTNLPLGGAYVVLSMPSGANDTLSAVTDNDGFAVFKPAVIIPGTYSVKASLYFNGEERSYRNTYYLNEMNKITFTMYITEKNLYR